VSPSDDDLLDLAECINEIGPGPTSNSGRFQGLPTLVMRGEHGHRVPCDPRQVTRVEVPIPPLPLPTPTRASWADTHHPPPEDTPLPQGHLSGCGEQSSRTWSSFHLTRGTVKTVTATSVELSRAAEFQWNSRARGTERSLKE
jgi:hypothetical protein